ncbi:glycosyltransferase [Desulfovibrio sulfodismutans]|uniref:Glycosyltransferase n=1 Tax=Desulfolutivibrio sulfodismutans TaxID=63561 RepID=A0A7K3NQU7_9BACT|nr:glycosyltransferase family 2 protein [Desulfolutivibrio sulfodismutans]NDY58501.1 glycosyltransferase [Desulfolutivibrio sulfodismutans]
MLPRTNLSKQHPVPVTLVPLSHVAHAPGDTVWRSLGETPRLELRPPGRTLPEGWIHLQGRLLRRSGAWTAFLHAEAGKREPVRFELPVSLKGTINEVLCLPGGVTRLVLEPMQGEGEFTLGEFSFKPVGEVERVRRMYQRIVAMFYKYPRARRKRAGLHSKTAILRLQEAYRIAGRLRTLSPVIPYDRWIREFDLLTEKDREAILRDTARLRRPPRFVVHVQGGHAPAARRATLASLRRQLYPHHEIRDAAPALAGGDRRTWFVFLPPGAALAPHALYWMARTAFDDTRVRLIYTDHDILDTGGARRDPAFKPDWSPELLRSTNYIGHAAAIRGDLLAALGLDPDVFDMHGLLLRAGERIPRYAVAHVPAPLFHLPPPGDPGNPNGSSPSQVAAHLERLQVAAQVEPTARGHCRVRYHLPPKPPRVSIIIPTRDCLAVLRTCLTSLLEKTDYRRFEIRIVDNSSRDPETLDYLARINGHPQVKVLRYDLPFNYSAINNHAAAHCTGDALCLLNNDTEVIGPGWLTEMLGHLVQPGVGVVGAKLYYTDGRIQHAGDVVGPGGCANHLHACLEGDDPGYCDRAILAQELSAVTAACLLTWKDVYDRMKGLDAVNLPVAFNDVDYCLRVRKAGLRVVWTPYAELYHHESYSRGDDSASPERKAQARREVRHMRAHWKHVMRHDPFYNPNCSYSHPDFSLNIAPLVRKPWLNRP